jgi:DNA-binding response OmpR family regulator
VDLITEILKNEGYRVTTAYNGKDALDLILRDDREFDMLILDVMMPGIGGLELCRQIRAQVAAPILLLSGKDRESDRVIGLEIGADDYVTKPFLALELVSRVKAHIRRDRRNRSAKAVTGGIVSFGNLVIHKDRFELYIENEKVPLSTKEFQILLYFAETRGRVVSREQIYNAIWGNTEYGDINTVTVHIKNLRDKLGPAGRYIKTVWGAGYKFTAEEND